MAKTPAQQLDGFIAKFAPEIAAIGRAALGKMRKLFPGTHELVYDNYNALAVGWTPTGKMSDITCSIAFYPRWVSVFFMRGTSLDDPDALLQGSGKTIRHIVLANAATLDAPAVQALIEEAKEIAPAAATGTNTPVLVIKSISKTQRPRRAPGKPAPAKRRKVRR